MPLSYIVHVLVISAVGFACFWAWRWMLSVWRPFGIVVGFGLLMRVWAGVGLFLISYYKLPILASLHTSDGFWSLAVDAPVYFQLAANAAAGAPIPHGSPSPSFLEALGLWLRATGDVPSSAVLFNLVGSPGTELEFAL